MFGISGTEFVLIAAVALLLFGPDKLPEIARTIGRFTAEFKRYQAMMESVIRAEVYAAQSEAATKSAKEDPFKAAREYREKAGTTIPGQEPQASGADTEGESAAEAVLEDEEYDPELAAPDLADTVWTPGAAGAPGIELPDETEQSGEEVEADA
ncbi:twin-arginine translocase TatA/TatE family subunit [Coriobacteriia bacterium Es71-Z0120]|uniref:Sec-independent protein translocase subunit TatA/TatB n=1 Tax=Parvivirga hydrogeniphila TaxID=2939460 RepID=UPI002260E679|nr:twin-arginine translocase TatA/TatE family subunit [Parvivirga hydrogeniphila]MCL4079310.1 twin-arginine translocase TatA/TatE family subunit [Parvivirga hydrogeniphila]